MCAWTFVMTCVEKEMNEWLADLLRGNTPTAEWEEKNFIPDIFDESLA